MMSSETFSGRRGAFTSCFVSRVLALTATLIVISFAGASAQGDLVVDADQDWPEGTYAYDSLTVTNSATLRIAGGSSVTVAGEFSIATDSAVVLQGKDASAQVGGLWVGQGVSIEANTLDVATGGFLSADGQGYTCPGMQSDGNGPGGGANGYGNTGGGGAYGGDGGRTLPGVVAAHYGSPLEPIDLGSAGGTGDEGAPTGHGGGAMHLVVHDLLTNNGTITANGNSASGDCAGGAGGSIWVEAARLGGSGIFQAEGGGTQWGSASGAGGRIAVYYTSNEGFDEAAGFSVQPGSSSGINGQEGTVIVIDESVTGNAVHFAHRYLLEEDETFTAQEIVIDNSALVEVGGGAQLTATGDLTVNGAGTILCRGKNRTAQVGGLWQGEGVVISANNLTVGDTGIITADGQGYTCPGMQSNGNGPGGGTNGVGNGGGGGAFGGDGGSSHYGVVASHYGSPTMPLDLGSAGGTGDEGSPVGHGGGAIRLTVGDLLLNNGTISANGAGASGDCAGGSGGAILVETSRLDGTGVFQSIGGSAQWTTASGAGGRIAVYYTTNEGFDEWDGFNVLPGAASSHLGQEGTVIVVDQSVPGDAVHFAHRYLLEEGEEFVAEQILMDNDALIEIGGGGHLKANTDMEITEATVLCRGKNRTGMVDESWQGEGVVISARNLTVATSSTITADGQGYTCLGRQTQGNGPGGGANGVGNGGGGGAYGGDGGISNASAIAAHYGSPTLPLDLGSAGGAGDEGSPVGHGGGAIYLSVEELLRNDGLVTANGAGASGDCAGGAGGSILVETNRLNGSGLFQAVGGGTQWGTGSGAGGRIAVYYEVNVGYDEKAGFSVDPGYSDLHVGQEGTVIVVDQSVTGDRMHFAHRYLLEPDEVFGAQEIIIDNEAMFEMGGGSQLVAGGPLLLNENSTIWCRSKNASAQVLDQWIGEGVTISAADLTIGAGSTITGDAQGYTARPAYNTAGNGPGGGLAGAGNSGGGGAYGGDGGVNHFGLSVLHYGSPMEPTDLGSAGGNGDEGVPTGHGGGAIHILVDSLFTNDGLVTMNGGSGAGDCAGGSGGSIWVESDELDGVGLFRAEGGGTEWGTASGGGGRIAVYYSANSGYDETDGFSVDPGFSSARVGQEGTVIIVDETLSGGRMHVAHRFFLEEDETFAAGEMLIDNEATFEMSGGSHLKLSRGDIAVEGNATILAHGKNRTAMVGGVWAGAGIQITAYNFAIDAGATINADGEGYTSPGRQSVGNGPGGGCNGVGSGGGGGAYGGDGGLGYCTPVALHYGSPLYPMDLGSGGGAGDEGTPSGHGGGAVYLKVVNTLTLNGTVSCNGASGTQDCAGGAGGSILVETDTIKGSGLMQAVGGDTNWSTTPGGGGGRIAVHYDHNTNYSGSAGADVSGGASPTPSRYGQQGTVVFVDESVPGLAMYFPHRFFLEEDEQFTVWSAQIENASEFEMAGGSWLDVLDETRIINGSTVLARGKNRTALVNDEWAGQGVKLTARNFELDETSLITATGQGYISPARQSNGYGPGGGGFGNGNGGGGAGHGGYGGAGSVGVPGLPYGSMYIPLDLGSGGGTGDEGTPSGHGGGAIEIATGETLTIDGNVEANGLAGSGDCAGGSGGSVLLNAANLTGSGFVTAIGGNVEWQCGAGAGGRIAAYSKDGDFTETQLNVSGGTGGQNPGEEGSIVLSPDPYIVWTAPNDWVLHDTEEITWRVLGTGWGISSRLRAYRTGWSTTVASGFSDEGSAMWDTTSVADGVYQLQVSVRDTSGHWVTDSTMNALVNNSLEWHSGSISGNEFWSADKVHCVEGDLHLTTGSVVTLASGAVVKFTQDSGITVESGAILDASAASRAQIIFTSLKDDEAGGDSNLDGGASRPLPGDWVGITVESGGQFLRNENVELRWLRTTHSGILADSELWSKTSIHHITGVITVPSGITLEIAEGAIVKFDPMLEIVVQGGGNLIANGTLVNPITFTSIRDDSIGGDTNEDGDATTPAPGDWRWLHIDGGTATLEHVRITYGAGSPTGNWDSTGAIRSDGNALINVSNSEILDSLFNAVMIQGGTAIFENCLIVNCERGLQTQIGDIIARHCTIDDCRHSVLAHGGKIELYNSIISNSLEVGLAVCCGSPPIDMRYSNVWSTQGINFSGMEDIVGTNGNVSVDPEYKNATRRDYGLYYVSPMIDAAEGDEATQHDFYGSPRYDDPRTPNTGTAMLDGTFPDMGAIEFVETAPSPLDLVVTSIMGPSDVVAGTTTTLRWTISNLGSEPVTGPWFDLLGVSDSTNPDDPGVEIGEAQVGEGLTLAPGKTTSGMMSFLMPAAIPGAYHWRVRTNSHATVFEGANLVNNNALSIAPVNVDLQPLVVDGSAIESIFTEVDRREWFRVDVPGGVDVKVSVTRLGDATTALYASRYDIPSSIAYEVASAEWGESSPDLFLPSSANPTTWFITMNPETLAIGVDEYSIAAVSLPFGVEACSPSIAGNLGNTTFDIRGAGFESGIGCKLDHGGAQVAATSVEVLDSTHLRATFPLAGATPGAYDLRIEKQTSQDALANAVIVQRDGSADIWTDISGPDTIRRGRKATYTLRYGNRGNTNAYGGVIYLANIPPSFGLSPDSSFGGHGTYGSLGYYSPTIVTNSDGMQMAGPIVLPMLRPGETGSSSFTIKPSNNGDFQLAIYNLAPSLDAAFCPACPPTRSDSYRDEFCDFPEDELEALREAYRIAQEHWYQNNFLMKFWNTACVGAADDLRTKLHTEGSVPGNPLNGWSVTRITKNGLGIGHTTVMLTSPNGNSYIVDNYVESTLLPLDDAGPDEWIVNNDCYQTWQANFCAFLHLENLIMGTDPDNTYTWKRLTQNDTVTCPLPEKKPNNKRIKVISAADPNDKSAPSGVGDEGFISGNEPLVYTVHFENVTSATASAQEVIVTDQIDSALDWSTLEIEEIGFNDAMIVLPASAQVFTTQTLVSTDPNPVEVAVSFDQVSGIMTLAMRSIDPNTRELVEDPLAGFLPPNDEQGTGEGYIRFRIDALPDLPDGTQILNQANIVFDLNDPILTNLTVNTIDSQAPDSGLTALPGETNSSTVELEWTMDDGPAGSGAAFVDIYVSEDGGELNLWRRRVFGGTASYSGELGHTYGFATRASDNVGLQEPIPDTIETSTLLNAPRCEVTPTSIDYGTMTHSATKQELLTIKNTGSEELQFTGDGITVTGAAAASYTIIQLPSLDPMAVDEERTVLLRCNPSDFGQLDAQLVVTTNDPDHPTVTVDLMALANKSNQWVFQ
ncbi:hypothetical protein KQI84_01100 [bacterium]|nr:hypothetical protein [bacterium]